MTNIQRTVALIGGIVLTLVGIAGFFTHDVLGFTVNALHSGVHLLSGIVALALALSSGGENSHYFNKWFGVVYLLVAVLGFVVPGMMMNLLNINMADNILHIVLGVVFAGVGFGVKQ